MPIVCSLIYTLCAHVEIFNLKLVSKARRASDLLLGRSVVATLAAGKPTRMCHHSRCDFLVMSADAVMAATRFLRAERIKAAVGHHGIVTCVGYCKRVAGLSAG